VHARFPSDLKRTPQWSSALCVFAVLWLIAPASARAQGGPPLITDDPDTPGPGYWEINIPMILESSEEGRDFEAPLADINYGVGRRIQLKFEIPWVTFDAPERSAQTGIGNSTSGVKWRFLGQEGQRFSWSVYPQLATNTSDSTAAKGLVEKNARLILPTEFTVQRGRFEINGEVGRILVQRGQDGWMAGVTTEIEFARGLELLGELHADHDGAVPTALIVNVGARQKISKTIVLLGSGGAGVHGPAEERVHLRVYAGVQFNLPGDYDPRASSLQHGP
jgi:hypothetical protein